MLAAEMPSRGAHILIGAVTGLVVESLSAQARGREPTSGGMVRSAALGAAGGLLPDWLEPALDPNHRGLFHSTAGLLLELYLLWQASAVVATRPDTPEWRALLAGYSSHLVADARTPAGLPLVGLGRGYGRRPC